MATTQKGIYYPDNYSVVADIPADMEDLAESVDTLLDDYQGKVAGKGLSQNDFTNAYKDKLDGIEAEANKTIVDSALSDSSTNPVQNKVVKEALDTKVDKVTGKGLSEEDYTSAEKTKLAGIEDQANKTIVDDELDNDSTNPVQNKVLKGIIDAQASEITALKERNAKIISQIPTEDVSGESIDIYDSSDLEFEEFGVEGRSTQETYNGENLFDKNTMGRITRYINVDADKWQTSADSYSVAIPCKPNRSYTISHSVTTATIFRCAYIKAIAIPSTGDITCYNVYRGTTDTSYTITTGEDATYLIFQGNASAMPDIINSLEVVGNFVEPSPSYPQPIYSAGDNGSITEKIINKNYWNASNFSRNTVGVTLNILTPNDITLTGKATWSNVAFSFLNIKENSNFALRFKMKSTLARKCGVTVYGNDTNSATNGTNLASLNKDITPNKEEEYSAVFNSGNYKYIIIRFWNNDTATALSESVLLYINDIQLEENSVVTSYVSYSEQNISIPCQQPMRGIGDIKDEFVKISGVWYERHYINSVVLTGAEEVTKGTNANRIFVQNMSQFNYCTNSGTKYDAQCSHENSIRSAASTESNSGMGFYNSKILWNKDYFENMTAEQAQTFLATEYQAGHPVTVNHIPPTPTDLPCTAEQIAVLESLPQLKSYRNVTHIYSNDTTPAYVDVVYKQDLTTLRDRTNNKLDNLEARVALLED